MSIIDISKKPISIIKNSTISDAIRMLLDTKISRLVVVDNGKHVGIITEKDIAKSISVFSILIAFVNTN